MTKTEQCIILILAIIAILYVMLCWCGKKQVYDVDVMHPAAL